MMLLQNEPNNDPAGNGKTSSHGSLILGNRSWCIVNMVNLFGCLGWLAHLQRDLVCAWALVGVAVLTGMAIGRCRESKQRFLHDT